VCVHVLCCAVLQDVYDWVDSLEAVTALRYSLATSYPRRVFKDAESMGSTLADVGLAPQAVLLLQPEDS
jgi:hypothetical protein